ncbi:hypothetical protein QJQ45_030161 [Haematococcus lacustris]|nr:hypothetical protein QJQ45_030161 [Haematococcus lacustris]
MRHARLVPCSAPDAVLRRCRPVSCRGSGREPSAIASQLSASYRLQLQSLQPLLTPEAVQQLQRSLGPEDLVQLQYVLEDIEAVCGPAGSSSRAGQPPPSPVEAASSSRNDDVAQLLHDLPPDFDSYLIEHMMGGGGRQELEAMKDAMGRHTLEQLAL